MIGMKLGFDYLFTESYLVLDIVVGFMFVGFYVNTW